MGLLLGLSLLTRLKLPLCWKATASGEETTIRIIPVSEIPAERFKYCEIHFTRQGSKSVCKTWPVAQNSPRANNPQASGLADWLNGTVKNQLANELKLPVSLAKGTLFNSPKSKIPFPWKHQLCTYGMTTEQPTRMDKGRKSRREIIRMTVKDLNNSDYKLKIGSSLSTVNT